MGKSTVDAGKIKSMAAGRNWPRPADLKKTAKLGTEKNPAVVHVRTEERLKEVSSLFAERGWEYKASLAPDKPEDIADLERLLNPPKPIRVEKKLGRNELCACGSGKKYKSCCAA